MMHASDIAQPSVGLVRGKMERPQAQMRQSPAEETPGGDALVKVVLAAMKVLYEKQTSDGVVAMLRTGDPVHAVAQTTLFVMKALYDASRGSIPKEVMLPAASVVIGLVSELANAAGVKISGAQAQSAAQLVQEKLGKRFGGQQQPAAPQTAPPAEPQAAPMSMQGA